MEALNEVNHHIRNALQALAFTAGALKGTKEGAIISESIQRIQWALPKCCRRSNPTTSRSRAAHASGMPCAATSSLASSPPDYSTVCFAV